MPFQESLYFAVARHIAAESVLSALQIDDAQAVFSGTTPTGTTWDVTAGTLHHSDGSVVFGFDAGPLFTALYDSGAGTATQHGTVHLIDVELLQATLNATQLASFADAFVTGGQVRLNISIGGNPAGQLTVQLRAFKTNHFLLGAAAAAGHVAHIAHNTDLSSGSLNNTDGPEALNSYTSCTVTDTVSYNQGVTLTAEGHIDFSAGGAPPPVGASLRLEFTVPLANPRTSRLPIDVDFATDMILMLDRSGSMGASIMGVTKWEAARDTANLVSRIFGSMQRRNVVGGDQATVREHNRTTIGHFTFPGATDVQLPAFVGADTIPQLPGLAPSGGTPIGSAMAASAALFVTAPNAPDKWRRRQLVLLTDGMGNSGDPRLSDPTPSGPPAPVDSSNFPSLSDNVTTGVILHALSYARDSDTPLAELQAQATSHNGNADATFIHPNPVDAAAIREVFLNVLPSILPVEYQSKNPTSGSVSFTVDDGVDSLFFVLSDESGVNLSTPAGAGAVTTGTGGGFSWALVEAPIPRGDYTLTGVTAAKAWVFEDLSLRSKFGADAPGLGQPIRLWAELRHHGRPVSGATVTATGHVPAESLGEILTRALNEGLLARAIRAQLIDPRVLQMALDIAQGNPSAVDVFSVQSQLLHALEVLRELGLQYTATPLVLGEVIPGRYEAIVPTSATQNESGYTFRFHAEGVTPYSSPFARDHRLTVVLPPVPDPTLSEVFVTAGSKPGTVVATVLPKNHVGRPLGPGLVPALSFQYSDFKRPDRLPIIDNLDGTYSTLLTLENGQVPGVGLFWGRRDPCTKGVSVGPAQPAGKRVVVRLTRIQVLDDKDPLIKGKGELVFKALVAPNGSPSRAVATRLPASGHYSLGSGQSLQLNHIIYSGTVENDATLAIAISGTELDWPSCLDRNDELARYVRKVRVPTRTIHMSPTDEVNDPESLADWRLWYTIEVD